MIKSTDQDQPAVSFPLRIYSMLPARLQRLLLLRAALARAALMALLATSLNLRPVRADTGPFTLSNPFAAVTGPAFSKPALADLDNDGDLDILVGEVYGDLHYFQNIGSAASPTFAAPVINPFGLTNVGYNSTPALADLDNDGDLDLMTGDEYGDLHYFQNSGNAANPLFSAPVENPFGLTAMGDTYSVPALADLDNDGDLDLLVGAAGGALHYFHNSGSPAGPAFDAPVADPFGLAPGGYYSAPDLADLDNDGDLDLLNGDEYGSLYYFQNTGSAASPTFDPPLTDPFGLANAGYYSTPALADLDNDGDLDLLAGAENGRLYYFQNTGSAASPAFTEIATNPFNLAAVSYENVLALGDLDNDGDLDVVLGECCGDLYYFENTGSAQSALFAAPLTNPFGLDTVSGGYSAPALADLDNDGDLDLLSGEVGGNFHYFENTGTAQNPSFAAAVMNPFGLVQTGFKTVPALADLDNDGDLDLLSGNDYDLHYFKNNGTAGSPAFGPPVVNPFGLIRVSDLTAPTLADMDNDGDLDILVGTRPGNLYYFENTGSAGSPVFATPLINPFGLARIGYDSAPALADMDDDGDLDLLVGESYGHSIYFRNIGVSPSLIYLPIVSEAAK